MPERTSKSKPRDLNRLAASIVEEAAGDEKDAPAQPEKNPHAAALGKLGGKKGGPARAMRLSADRRQEIARKAAEARWHPDRQQRQTGTQ